MATASYLKKLGDDVGASRTHGESESALSRLRPGSLRMQIFVPFAVVVVLVFALGLMLGAQGRSPAEEMPADDWWIVGGALLSIALVVGGAWLIAGRITRSLERLRDQATAVASGDFTARVTPDRTREVNELGHAFNSMADVVKQSAQRYEQSRVRLESILSGLADGVVLTREDERVVRMNAAAERMLQVSEDTAIGLPFVQVSRDYELSRLLRDALAGEERADTAVEHGLNRRTLLTTAQVIGDAGERLGLVVLRDISDLRRLETVRREFVANVSHELRTPLTSIRALAETLEAGALDEREVALDFTGRILNEVERLTALVEDLLDLARLEAGRAPLQLELLDVGELVRQGAERLRPQLERAGLTLTVHVGEGLSPIPVDRSRMEQVLLNIVHNAMKFTPSGGEVVVSVQQRDQRVEIRVRDTGVGVAPDDLVRLFERFYKSDKARTSQGTGLGLAIAKHIVQQHGGEISAESTLGDGTEVTIVVPLSSSRLLPTRLPSGSSGAGQADT